MKKALVLCFSVDKYTQEVFRQMTSEELYEEAKANIESGDTDIYTLEDFCFDINDGDDVLTEWFVYPIYVEEEEYKNWYK